VLNKLRGAFRGALSGFRFPVSGFGARRSFAAAASGPHLADWIASATSADTEIRASYRKLIDRSRGLERDNDYQRGFLLSCQRNINGAHRYDLRSDAGEYVTGKDKKRVWQSDIVAKSLIEEAWTEWGKRGTCTVCRKYSWRDVRRLAVRNTVRDGNFLARKIRGASAGNRFGFALQLWEIDHLDLERHDERTREGHEIRFGIEFNPLGAPVAYWLRARHPGDSGGAYGRGGYVSTRFPASDIYHFFIGDRAEQSIGYPWVVSAITRLRQLGAFEEAAVIAARLGASNAMFFETTENSEWLGDVTADGRPVMDVEPGTSQALPQGWKLSSHTPHYPNIETGDFRKAMLRGVCTALGVSYTGLGNDLEAVNFSSARVGLFEEREGWKELQLQFDEGLWSPIHGDWLEQSIIASAINLPLGKFAKFNRPVFKARRWAMIDPLKEINALQTGIALRVESRRGFIENQGGDVEEVFHDNKDDEDLAEDIGLELAAPEPVDPTAGEEESDENSKPKAPNSKPKAAPRSLATLPAAAPITLNLTLPAAPAREKREVKIVRDEDGRAVAIAE
jgi:lambda family phage portal protein